MVFVRYIHDGKIVDDFFTTEGLSWENVVGICTDGAPAMLCSHFRFLKIAKKYNPSIVGFHCMIHRQALASKTLHDLIRATNSD